MEINSVCDVNDDGTVTITFNMKNDVLKSITISGTTDCDGTYEPAPTMLTMMAPPNLDEQIDEITTTETEDNEPAVEEPVPESESKEFEEEKSEELMQPVEAVAEETSKVETVEENSKEETEQTRQR